jgi:hypothetical protein
MHQFRVTLPDHVKSGDTIRVQYPDGTEADVRVPSKLKGGDVWVLDKRGFLDREIVTMQDCCVAMGVGLMIGCAIVVGFLCGVLSVTDANQAAPASSYMLSANAANTMVTSAATTAPLAMTETDGFQQLNALGPLATTAAMFPGMTSCDQLPEPRRSRCVEQQLQIQVQQIWQEQMARQKVQLLQSGQLPLVQQQQQQQQQPLLGRQEGGQSFYRQDNHYDL